MDFNIINENTDYQIASFYLDGEKISLVPSKMSKTGDRLYYEYHDLKAYIFFESKNEYSLWTLSFENTGENDSGQISKVRTLDIDIVSDGEASLYTLAGDNNSPDSFKPINRELNMPLTVKPNGGRSSCTTGFPFFDIKAGDKAYLFAIGWTGQWIYEITPEEKVLNISAGLEYADFYLKPGESVRGISVFCIEGKNQSELRRLFKRIQFKDFNPVRHTGKETLPFSIQPYDRYFYGQCPDWPTEKGQLRTLEATIKCEHFDTFWIDAAWFKMGFPHGVGNYSFETGFPNGLKPVSDAVHNAGMRFMVWFEPERVYEGSELFEEHQEFLLKAKDPNTRLFNLGNPDAWEWLHNTIKAFISDNGIDNYRQDFNFEPLEYWLLNDEEDRCGINEMKHIEGLYRLWDTLKEDFPGLFIDNCASGGRRLDFETMRRAAPMWRCDIPCRPATEENHTYTWNQNQTLVLSEYLQYHACASWEPIAYHMRSAATAGLACTFDILNPEYDYERARKAVGEAVRLGTKYVGYDFYPMSDFTLDETGFAAWRYENEKGGCIYIFRRNECKENAYVIKLPAVCKNATYTLTITDEDYNMTERTASGSELAEGFMYIIDDVCKSAVIEYEMN